MSAESRQGAYRADIDGLRAVAVLVVVLYHAGSTTLTGGFVGVDIFFVISGFLITRIILQDRRAARFSYRRFYERRLRRIIPALFAVALFSTAYVLVMRAPFEVERYGQSISFLALMFSNQFFYQEVNYFANAADGFLLLHTWSLAVEEQFYLVFPLLVGLAYAPNERRLRMVIAALLLVSLGASIMATQGWASNDPELSERAGYFLTPYRGWELLIGAVLALISMRPLPRMAAELLGAAGLLAIAIAVLVYDQSTLFPGAAALLPTLGTAALIIAGAQGSFVNRALSLRGPVFIGRISYSLYLWHWPILVIARDLNMGPLSTYQAGIALAVAGVVAWMSYRWIEQPFRDRGDAVRRPRIALRWTAGAAGVITAFFLAFGGFLQTSKGWPARWPDMALQLVSEEARRFGVNQNTCRAARDLAPEDVRGDLGEFFCITGDREAERLVVVWGDSHMNALWPAVHQAGRDSGWRVLHATKGACPPLLRRPEDPPSLIPLLERAVCARHAPAVLAVIEALEPDRVLLLSNWPSYARAGEAHETEFDRLIALTISEIKARGADVYVAVNAPVYPQHVPLTMARSIVLGIDHGIDFSRASHDERVAPFVRALNRHEDALAAPLLRFDEEFCDAQTCAVFEEGDVLYLDSNHLNYRGALTLVPALAPVFADEDAVGSSGSD